MKLTRGAHELVCYLPDPDLDGTHHFLVTLIGPEAQERLIDLLVADGGFAAVREAINRAYGASWKIWESLLIWEYDL